MCRALAIVEAKKYRTKIAKARARQRKYVANISPEAKAARRERDRLRQQRIRDEMVANGTIDEYRRKRNEAARLRRLNESPEESEARRAKKRAQAAARKENNPEAYERVLQKQRERRLKKRQSRKKE
jgi:hypothetical protein